MKKLLVSNFALSIAVIFLVLAMGQERITLDAPVQATLGATRFRVNSLLLQVEPPLIVVQLWEADAAGAFLANPRVIEARYDGPLATTLINQLNTVNLSTTSLQKRIMQRLQADGKIGAGTYVGTP